MTTKSKKITRSNVARKSRAAALAHLRAGSHSSVTLVATAAMKEAIAACEAKVDAIVKECQLKNCKFRDTQFDLLNDSTHCLYSSIANGENTYSSSVNAKRVTEIFRNPEFYIDGVAPDDIEQGQAGDCWFVAALAAICNVTGLLERLCVKRNEEVGVYGFIFFKDGDWVSTVVDDQLFYITDYRSYKRSLYFSSCSDERETWLPLMEKAYAKIHGDYESLEGGWTAEGIEDISGGVASQILTSDILSQDRFWNEEMLHVNKSFLLGCHCSDPEANPRNGIQTGHAYSVIQVAEFEGQRLVKVRNPWGKVEWNGDWSDRSDCWTPEAIKQLQVKDKDDGQFWMTYKDFLSCFTEVDRCRVFDSTWSVASSWIPYNVEPRSHGRYQVEVKEASQVVIVLSQPDSRYFGGLSVEFINKLSFHIYETEGMKLVLRARPMLQYSNRSVNCELHLEPGHYTIVPFVTREAVAAKRKGKATDVGKDGEGKIDQGDNAVNPSMNISDIELEIKTVKMDEIAFLFEQRKAKVIRSMSIARIKGRTLLGVDDEDYMSDSDSDVEEEEKWQVMLGLRVYSHDANLILKGEAGNLPEPKSKAKAKTEEKDVAADKDKAEKTNASNDGDKLIKEAEKEAAAADPENVTPTDADKTEANKSTENKDKEEKTDADKAGEDKKDSSKEE